MLCRKPYMAGSLAFGCGQCLPCRVNRRRQWMWRQYLESLCHEHNSFITLTYDRRHIPGNWQLCPRDLQVFIREFRRGAAPTKVRYYAVGEYGEESFRPHYHVSLFGMSPMSCVQGKLLGDYVSAVWGKGFTATYEFNHLTAQYVAGYVVKKLKDYKDDRRWIVQEFARMSNRPGIGARAMETIAKSLNSNYSSWKEGDVPHQLRIGDRKIPLGRYLLSRLRKEVGFSDDYVKEVRDRASYEKSVEMQSLLEGVEDGSTIKAKYLENIEGKLRQVEERAKMIRRKRRGL